MDVDDQSQTVTYRGVHPKMGVSYTEREVGDLEWIEKGKKGNGSEAEPGAKSRGV